MKGSNEEALRVFGATGTKEILEFLDEQSTGKYKEMAGFVNSHSLNDRLRDLLGLGLISYHLERDPKKKEWYEITEKGKQALQHLRALIEIHRLIDATGTKQILEFLDEHGKGQYKEMEKFMNTGTLNHRLRDLLGLGLVSHHSERNPKKRQWYEITENGKQALQHLRALIELT